MTTATHHATVLDIARGQLGNVPVPVAVSLFANISMPLWRQYLQMVSDTAAAVGPVVAVLSLIWTLYQHRAKPRPGDAVKTVGQAAGVAAKSSWPVLLIVVATLGTYLVYSAVTSKRADAAPASQTQTSGRRTKSKDDAGDDGEAKDAGNEGDPPWLQSALADVGTREALKSGKSNPIVVRYFADAGHPGVKNCIATPWCSAYVGAHLERCGHSTPKNLMARSWLRWGSLQSCDSAERGDVVVIWRGKSDDGVYGHVFFFTEKRGDWIYGVGGNQGDAVSVARFHVSKVLGVRRPRSIAKSKTVAGAIVSGTAATGASVAVIAEAVADKPVTPGPNLEAVAEVAQAVKSPLQQMQYMLPHGSTLYKVLAVSGAVLGLVGAAVVIQQRLAIRRDTGR